MVYKRLTKGQTVDDAISASTWNAFVDLLTAVGPDLNAYGSALSNGSRVIVQVKNDTTSPLSPYHVVGLANPVVAPTVNLTTFQQSICFSARVPNKADSDQFAICAAAIPIGEIGPAVLAGVVPVQIEMAQSWHRAAKSIDGDRTKLRSTSGGGARILWVQSGTGLKWALVQFPFESPIKMVLANTDLDHSGSADWPLAQAPAVSGPFTASADVIRVWNAREMIWNGSICLGMSADFRAGTGTPTDSLVIFQAFSATRIRGKAQGDIAPGTTGTIENIVPEDGHYAPSGGEADAYLPTEHVIVKDGMPCWAHLRWDTFTQTTRWELYSSDCEDA